jgi:hypothetical protein
MDEQGEMDYRRGQRSAWRRVLSTALGELGYDSTDPEELRLQRLIAEREDAIAALRRLCEDYGDNDWDDHLHLADIIDKHLYPWNK